MKALVVGASKIFNTCLLKQQLSHYSYVVAVDGGVTNCRLLGYDFHYVVGDFDSYTLKLNDNFKNITKLETMKDETDMFVAIKKLIDKGYKKIDIIGGMGGRFDHTYSNVQLINNFCCENVTVKLIDEQNVLTILSSGTHKVMNENNSYVSFFSLVDSIITLKNFKYEIDNYKLKTNDSLCVSNEFLENKDGEIFINGKILMVISKK